MTACDRLAREFMKYVIHSGSLRKVFLSIKGIYYQVNCLLRACNLCVSCICSSAASLDCGKSGFVRPVNGASHMRRNWCA